MTKAKAREVAKRIVAQGMKAERERLSVPQAIAEEFSEHDLMRAQDIVAEIESKLALAGLIEQAGHAYEVGRMIARAAELV